MDVVTEAGKGDRAGYKKANVTYKTAEGKVEGRNIVSFSVTPETWDTLVNAKKTDWYEVEREKDKSGKYWNWVSMSRQDKAPEVAVPAKVNTFEERNKLDQERLQLERDKQRPITRLSCISSAVEYMAAYNKGTNFSPEDVVSVAKVFEQYALNTYTEEVE